jgi:hypothetical protein
MVREHMVEEGMTHHLKNMGNSIIRKTCVGVVIFVWVRQWCMYKGSLCGCGV